MTMQAYTPSQRIRALFYFFGWQGGTIHQLAEATGLPVQTILEAEIISPIDGGFSAIRTCDRAWRIERLAPKAKGDWHFYSSAIAGFWCTGPLDNLDDRYPEHHA
jgi:hypothetical protein